MRIFSLMLLSIALVVPFALTAFAGWTGTDFEDKRARTRGMFGLGCMVYAVVIGTTVCAAWFHNAEHLPQVLLGSMLLWGIPLSSSAAAMLLLWRKPPARAADPPDIGFSPGG